MSDDGCPLCGSGVTSDADRRRWQLWQVLGKRFGIYDLPEDLKLSVVVPAYNEVATIDTILERILQVPIRKEIIVVDDGSTDGTGERLRRWESHEEIKVLRHPKNRGKGAALRTAFSQSTGQIVVIQDADLEYDPAEHLRLIQPIVDDVADVVYGSRFVSEGPHRVLYYWHYKANRMITTLSNMFTDLNLTDVETCHKAFRREVLERITLEEDGFGFEPEFTAKVARLNVRIYETGVSYYGRTYADGKKINWRDGFRAVYVILKYGVFRR